MSYYVLRQIRPPGMFPIATRETAAALAAAAVNGTVVYGPYLEWSDPNAKDGRGAEGWTDDITKAQRFAHFMDAMDCWKAQSGVRPWRPDGRPNRPMTAYSVEPQRIDD